MLIKFSSDFFIPLVLNERKPKEKVPKHNESILLKREEKNFLINNLKIAKKPKPSEPMDFLKKKDFGRSPSYLNAIKEKLEQEKLNVKSKAKEEIDSKKFYLIFFSKFIFVFINFSYLNFKSFF